MLCIHLKALQNTTTINPTKDFKKDWRRFLPCNLFKNYLETPDPTITCPGVILAAKYLTK